jgi:hypothetical protein
MTTNLPQRPKGQEDAISLLNAAIDATDLADSENLSSTTPAKGFFGTVSALLTMIKVCSLLCVEVFQAHTQSGIDY